jgi:hypothetical protein
VKIPIIVELYDYAYENWSGWTAGPGRHLLLSQDTPNLFTPYLFDNTVSSLKIRPGPDFDPNVRYEVSFYRDFDYKAGQLVLTPGAYPDIHNGPHSFGDAMSSVKFGQGVPAAPPVSPIPVVAELYKVRLYDSQKYGGASIELGPGEYPDCRSAHTASATGHHRYSS